jgi:hypothetical protein
MTQTELVPRDGTCQRTYADGNYYLHALHTSSLIDQVLWSVAGPIRVQFNALTPVLSFATPIQGGAWNEAPFDIRVVSDDGFESGTLTMFLESYSGVFNTTISATGNVAIVPITPAVFGLNLPNGTYTSYVTIRDFSGTPSPPSNRITWSWYDLVTPILNITTTAPYTVVLSNATVTVDFKVITRVTTLGDSLITFSLGGVNFTMAADTAEDGSFSASLDLSQRRVSDNGGTWEPSRGKMLVYGLHRAFPGEPYVYSHPHIYAVRTYQEPPVIQSLTPAAQIAPSTQLTITGQNLFDINADVFSGTDLENVIESTTLQTTGVTLGTLSALNISDPFRQTGRVRVNALTTTRCSAQLTLARGNSAAQIVYVPLRQVITSVEPLEIVSQGNSSITINGTGLSDAVIEFAGYVCQPGTSPTSRVCELICTQGDNFCELPNTVAVAAIDVICPLGGIDTARGGTANIVQFIDPPHLLADQHADDLVAFWKARTTEDATVAGISSGESMIFFALTGLAALSICLAMVANASKTSQFQQLRTT